MTTWFRLSAFPSIKMYALPIMICQDGFITSHAVENIELLEDADVKNFVGEYEPEDYLLNPECPMQSALTLLQIIIWKQSVTRQKEQEMSAVS